MELKIGMGDAHVPHLLGLLVPVFKVRVQTETDLKHVVCEQLGVREDYFEGRIQTLFLNSKPVDNVETAVIHDGAVVALSAAMPGLVGATFRKGGRYSWMRRIISHEGQDAAAGKEQGWVTLKLFNLVHKELGPDFLKRGVWISGKRIREFFKDAPVEHRRHIRTMTVDGSAISPDGLPPAIPAEELVFVKIDAEG